MSERARRVRRAAAPAVLALSAVLLLTSCTGTPDPSDKKIRERADHAFVGLDYRLTPLMRQSEVVADWKADYCVDDPFTAAEWDCFASRNVALLVPDLQTGATAVDTELTRLGCHPKGDPSTIGLKVMLDHRPDVKEAHLLPPVPFQCGEDRVIVQPSDGSDTRHSIHVRPTAWPEAATGDAASRLMSGGSLAPEQSNRLGTNPHDVFLLVSAVRGYHSQ